MALLAAMALAATGTVSAMDAPAAAAAAPDVVLVAAPSATGKACTVSVPCSLTDAQDRARARAKSGAQVTVELQDGTYRLAKTWKFGAKDSGNPGKPITWRAAEGAAPRIVGSTAVTGWTEEDGGVWSAPVPKGSDSRQLYIDGAQAPIAQASAGQLGFSGWTGSATGYDISANQAAVDFFSALTADEIQDVEFVYPGANGSWTESRCRVDSFADGKLVMDQPCWGNVTARQKFQFQTGQLPSMNSRTMPGKIQNARALLADGQWYLDGRSSKLYYRPADGIDSNTHQVELPRLEKLVESAGTLAEPVHDIAFIGLEFAFATWNDPSTDVGFAEVQSNLRLTGKTFNMGMCNYTEPAGSCPWGAISQPLAAVELTASNNITFTQNRFVDLGGVGLNLKYGSSDNLIKNNEFTAISSTALMLGCTADPTPVNPDPEHHPDYDTLNPDPPQVIKDMCTPDPARVQGDVIGENEIMKNNSVIGNEIHRIGSDYPSAPGITMFFTQKTKVLNNNLHHLPYTAISAGVIQGHVDNGAHPDKSLNVNADNEISRNLIHDILTVRHDGSAIYVEGQQGPEVFRADGTVEADATVKRGLRAEGNVAYRKLNAPGPMYYDDAGAQSVLWQSNVSFSTEAVAQGGCQPNGHLRVDGNFFSTREHNYGCGLPYFDVPRATNHTPISNAPTPKDLPADALDIMRKAGVSDLSVLPRTPETVVTYVSAALGDPAKVLIGGDGLSSETPVKFGAEPAAEVEAVSPGFLIATAAGAVDPATQITVGSGKPQTAAPYRINDDDPLISYTDMERVENRPITGYDYNNDVHVSTGPSPTAKFSFVGSGIDVYGPLAPEQGKISIKIDGKATTVDTVFPSRPANYYHKQDANWLIHQVSGLGDGRHTIEISKVSGASMALDGFMIYPPAPPVPEPDGKRLSDGRPTAQSSDYGSAYGAAKAVDGNTDGTTGSISATADGRAEQAWWQVDLEGGYDLTQMLIWNRSGCCQDRLTNFSVIVSATPFPDRPLTAEELADAEKYSVIKNTEQVARPSVIDLGRTGRYVRIQQRDGNIALNIAEVRIYGE
ncbi:discoidin domain-containing protein [Streptomyces sp. NPDC001312]|uniref:galactose-binding domain-containing protein n=1 Tax=Streptomyces sp. NPDC001312 TaxID=3364561 RepID=UPI0036791C46